MKKSLILRYSAITIIVAFLAPFILNSCGLPIKLWPFCCSSPSDDECAACGGDSSTNNPPPILGPEVQYRIKAGSQCSSFPNCTGSKEVWLANLSTQAFDVRLLRRTYIQGKGWDTGDDQYFSEQVQGVGNPDDLDEQPLGCSLVKNNNDFCKIEYAWYVTKRTRIDSSNKKLPDRNSVDEPDKCVQVCELGSGPGSCIYGENSFPPPKNIEVTLGINWIADQIEKNSPVSLTQEQLASKFGEDPNSCIRSSTNIGMNTIENTGAVCSISFQGGSKDDASFKLRVGKTLSAEYSTVDPNGTGDVLLVVFPDQIKSPIIGIIDVKNALNIQSRIHSIAKTHRNLIVQTDEHCLQWGYQ